MNGEKFETILGEGTTLNGELICDGMIRLDGKFTGNITGSTIIIGKTAVIKADVKCSNLIIYGKLNGNVDAKQGVEIQPGGELRGDIRASSSTIREGAYFTGNCELKSKEKEHQ